MKKEVISDKQGICMVVMFILGSSLFFATGIEAKNDMWLAIIMAILISSLVLSLYSRTLSLFPEKDLFDIGEIVFGKYLGKVFQVIYIWFSLHLSALVLRNYGEFINTIGLTETPRVIPELFFIVICIWIVKLGIEGLGRCSEIFIAFIMLFLIAIVLLETKNMELDNLRPVLYNGILPVLDGATSVVSFPLCETVVFMGLFSSLQTKKSPYKVYLLGLIIGGTLLLMVSTATLLSLGSQIVSTKYFPNYASVRKISISNFIQRIEATLAVTTLFTGFIKISVCLLVATKGFAKLFKFDDYRFMVFPMGMLTLVLSTLSYKNIMEMITWGGSLWKYYALPFELLFPIIIFIGAEIKHRKNKII